MALVMTPLRVGYVPEHFATPLLFARDYFGLNADLIPFPGGTGAMIQALREREIDVSIGLTEGFIAGLGSKRSTDGNIQREGGYSLIGTYVETPLCWAISTGSARDNIKSVEGLRGRKMGVSRLGSGSHIMGFVLADEHKWFTGNPTNPPFTAHPLQDFQNLRAAVNDGRIDFFMWEHFTSKKFFTSLASQAPTTQPSSNPSIASSTVQTPSATTHTTSPFQSVTSPISQPGSLGLPSPSFAAPQFDPSSQDKIRKIGEIYTPWPSWHIVARHPTDGRLPGFFTALDRGVDYFEKHKDEAVNYISQHLPYSREDAQAWMQTVKFARSTEGVRQSVVSQTVAVLRKAGVLVESRDPEELTRMIGHDHLKPEDVPMGY